MPSYGASLTEVSLFDFEGRGWKRLKHHQVRNSDSSEVGASMIFASWPLGRYPTRILTLYQFTVLS